MRSIDERMRAVQRRTSRLRRRRGNWMVAAVVCLLALPLAGLVGKQVAGGLPASAMTGDGLFGASLLFGPNMGGYVLVAVVAAAIAVAITVGLMMRRSSRRKDKGDLEGRMHENPDQRQEGNSDE